MEIRIYGDPVLRRQAAPVESVDSAVRDMAREMLETMYANRGIGLAAEQVGGELAVCVLDVPADMDRDTAGRRLNKAIKMPLVVINPHIEDISDTQESAEEGCLSFPNIYVTVARPAIVRVSYVDLNGAAREVEARGLVGRALQHEIDHLNGVLFIDRVPALKRLALSGRLWRLRAAGRR